MKQLRALTLVGAVLGVTASASASPIYFTFTGTVTNTYHYDQSSGGQSGVTIDGIAPGVAITYVFSVDFAQQSEYQYGYPALTYTYNPADYSNSTSSQDYFLASYVTGDAFSRTPLNGNYYNYRQDWGYEYSDTSGYRQGFVDDYRLAESYDGTYSWVWDEVYVYRNCYSCSAFELGATFSGYNARGQYSASFGYYQYDQVYSTLTLTSIDGEVPEPATLVLLGSGLMGLAVGGRRKKAV